MNEYAALIVYITLVIMTISLGLFIAYGIKIIIIRTQHHKFDKLLKKPNKNEHDMNKLVAFIKKEN